MPLPKRKTSKARQGDRRSHLHLEAKELMECPQCHQPKLSHVVCPSCGTYDGRQVIDVETKTKKKADKAAKAAEAQKAAKAEAAAPEKEVKAEKPKKAKVEKPAKAEKPAKEPARKPRPRLKSR